jgi:CRISPR-associated protein Cst1
MGSALHLSGHPLQRCGAWSVALLVGRAHPDEVTEADLDNVAERVSVDVVRAATAAKDSAAYGWWKVLFALYPNAKPTHALRERDVAKLRPEIDALFATDLPSAQVHPCTFCAQPCGAVWSKAYLPMFDSHNALNNLPPGIAGWPVCRGCRLALWALPYGAWVTAGSATALTCDDPAIERSFCEQNVLRADRIRQLGFEGLPASAGPEAVTLRALREHADHPGASAALWMFKNDNQEPWLRVVSTRRGVVPFLRAMFAEPECLRGWSDLRGAMERRDKEGKVTHSGSAEVAKTLFHRDGTAEDRLLKELLNRSHDPDKISARTLSRWRELCRLYLKVMHEMDVNRLKEVAELLAQWIQKESTRGRFNEFRRASGSSYELGRLLREASARLFLDGRSQNPESIAGVMPQLLTDGPQGWRLRTQLYFEVMVELQKLGVTVGSHEDDEKDDTPGTSGDKIVPDEEGISA